MQQVYAGTWIAPIMIDVQNHTNSYSTRHSKEEGDNRGHCWSPYSSTNRCSGCDVCGSGSGETPRANKLLYIWADRVFPLHENLMNPYSYKDMLVERRANNYRISHARRIVVERRTNNYRISRAIRMVENAFGIMTNRFSFSLLILSVKSRDNKAVRQRSDLLFIATSFGFEESPCAVRTNTVGLGRLCTLFVLSTLLVFEHMHVVLSSMLVLCRTMVMTNTAAISNSRYADTDRVKNVFFIRFLKPHLDRAKAERMPADLKALPLPLSRRTPTCVH